MMFSLKSSHNSFFARAIIDIWASKVALNRSTIEFSQQGILSFLARTHWVTLFLLQNLNQERRPQFRRNRANYTLLLSQRAKRHRQKRTEILFLIPTGSSKSLIWRREGIPPEVTMVVQQIHLYVLSE